MTESENSAEVMEVDEIDLSEENPVNVNITTSAKSRSVVHRHFTLVGDKFHCKHCTKTFKIEKNGSTSNRLKHLKTMHESKAADTKPLDDGHKNTIVKAFKKYQDNNSSEEFQRLLVRFVLLTDQPFTITEAEAFIEVLSFGKVIPPAIPNGDSIRHKIFTLYEEQKKTIIQKLESAPGKVSLVADCWSSATGKSFHGIIASWIDTDWDFQQVVLDFDILNRKHKGKDLAESMFKVMDEFGISKRIMSITTDNASNADTMFAELTKKFQDNDTAFNTDNQRIRCLAHIINLACQASLRSLKKGSRYFALNDLNDESGTDDDTAMDSPSPGLSIYQKVKGAVRKIRTVGKLNHFCGIFQIKFLQLINDMPIRWNTTYLMLQRYLDLRQAIDKTLVSDPALHRFILNNEDWEVIEQIVKFLKPFYDMTNEISVQLTATLSLTAAIYIELNNHLESYEDGDGTHPLILSAAKDACEKLNKYYLSSNGLVYVMGIVFDPRCKLKWHKTMKFEDCILKSNLKMVVDHWKNHYKPNETSVSVALSTHDIIQAQMAQTNFGNKDELDKYLAEPPVRSSELGESVLLWWKANESAYRNLARMVRDFLRAAATGVPAECTFTMGTDLLTQKRLSMIAVTIRVCLTLKAWLKFEKRFEFLKAKAEAVSKKLLGDA